MDNWKTSSYSGMQADQCVEAAGAWRTSSYTSATGQCVETAVGSRGVRVRDTKDRSRKGLAVSRSAWDGFIGGLGPREAERL